MIAEVEYLYHVGEIDPESVHGPGVYVDTVVRADVTYGGNPVSGRRQDKEERDAWGGAFSEVDT